MIQQLPESLRKHADLIGRADDPDTATALRWAADEIERLRAALEEIDSWSRAYPVKVFPEPDFKRVRELLGAGGITLDAVSASNMRHVIQGIGEITRKALLPTGRKAG